MNNTRKYSPTVSLAMLVSLVFSCPLAPAKSIRTRELTTVAGVLLGPCGSAAAQGPNGSDDDYSNASIDNQIRIGRDELTATAATVVFRNTVENAGQIDDAYIITTPSLPPAFTVEVSTDFGEHYTPLDRWTSSVVLPVSYRASTTFFVRITAPAGLMVLTAYDTVIRATSTIDPAVTNDTIDRLYAGFVRLESAVSLVGLEGAPDISKALPGSEIEFAVRYTNISSAAGVGNSLLTARNLVINENGNAAPNNWGMTTEHIVGASDNQGGYIVGDREGSTSLSLVVTMLEPGQSGVFRFKRKIR